MKRLRAGGAAVNDSDVPLGDPVSEPWNIKQWRLERHLGGGGMGTVYAARDLETGEWVAVKVLHPEIANDGFAVARFEREAFAMQRTRHPNLVRLREVVRTEQGPALVMDLVRGRTLKDVLADRESITAGDCLRPVRQLAGALDTLHRAGFVHRDIKPGNLIVTPEGELTLIDLGIARTPSSLLTQPGTTIGTARFMSPEQATGKELTGASDQFAAAVVLFRVLEGCYPSSGASDLELLRWFLAYREPPAMTQVSKAVELVVHRALSLEPSARFPTMTDFADALDAAVKGEPLAPGEELGDEPPTVLTTPVSPFVPWSEPEEAPIPINDTSRAPRPPTVRVVSFESAIRRRPA